MIAGEHLEHVEIPNEQALHGWLAEHHAQQAGVRLVTWRSTSRPAPEPGAGTLTAGLAGFALAVHGVAGSVRCSSG